MTNNAPDGIWPPHEAFYLESMLHCTSAALSAADAVRDALGACSKCSPSSREWQECALAIVSGVQAIVVQGAAISRYFWPARSTEPHLSRAARLRAGLGMSENSPLCSRDLRNQLEHFDERLDDFGLNVAAGVIMPTYVGPLGEAPEVPIYLFRAYYTDVGMFEILGHRFCVQPILDEIQALHNRLVQCAEAGGRIPLSSGLP